MESHKGVFRGSPEIRCDPVTGAFWSTKNLGQICCWGCRSRSIHGFGIFTYESMIEIN